MQPTPTPSLLSADASRARAWTTTFHAVLFVGLLALGACRDPKVTAYRVPKEPATELPATKAVHGAQASAAMPAMPAMPAAPAQGAAPAAGAPGADTHGLQTASGPGLAWSAPTGWQQKPATMMRKATYAIAGENGSSGELAISAFPGDVGGDVANVNRWRGQVGLAEVGEAEALASIQAVESNGLKIGVVDLVDASNPNATHLIGAMVPFEGATWFFKLVGSDPAVAQAKPAFLAFLKTVKPAAAATP